MAKTEREEKEKERKFVFTEDGVRKLKPEPDRKGRKAQHNWYDAKHPGLILRVNWGGTKSWRVLFYVGGKTKSHGLGYFAKPGLPETERIGVKRARELAGEFKANLAEFLARPPEQPAKATFKQIADDFLKREVEGKLRSAGQIKATLTKIVYSSWENRPFEELRRRDVTKLLDNVADTRGLRAADMVLAVIRRMTNWYQARNDDYVSPIVKGMARTKTKERARKRILTDDEIRALWAACDREQTGTFGALVKMCLLTAQRRTKVATMLFDNLTDDIWIIATEAREKGNAERLKLPPVAMSIVEEQRKLAINDYIFPASREGRRKGPGKHFGSYSAFGQGKEDLDKAMAKTLPNIPPWQIHDLRRTARSLMARADVRPDIAERVLGHAIVGVEGTYDRHSYDEQRAAALVALASLIDRIIDPPAGNVISIKGR